ncbi:MAG: ATP-binding protein [Saprospiraceae bacterium]
MLSSLYIRSLVIMVNFIMLCVYGIQAQSGSDSEKLTIEDGLSQGFITHITQDKEGFLWIGTSNGLNRYDGKEIKKFTHDPLNPYSIASNWINSVADLGSYMLVGLRDGLVDIYDKRTRQFYRLSNLDSQPQKRAYGIISSIWIDSESSIWIVEDGNNVINLKLSKKSGKSMPEVNIIREFNISNKGECRNINLKESGNQIWGLNRLMLISIDKKTGQKKIHLSNNADLRNYLITPEGTVWLAGINRIGKYENGSFTWIKTDFIAKYLEYKPQTKQVLVADDKRILLFDNADFKLPFVPAAKAEQLLSIDKGVFNFFYRDRSGILWVGTNGYGIWKYSPVLNRFHNTYTNFSIYAPLHVDIEGNLCFLVNNYAFQTSIQGMSDKHPLYPLRNLIDRNSLSQIDENGDYWFVTPKTSKDKRFFIYKLPAHENADWELTTSIPFDTLTYFAIQLEKRNFLWLAYRSGLLKLNLATNEVDAFDYSNLLTDRTWVNAITKTNNGVIWIGTSLGLIKANPKGQEFDFELLTTDPGNEQTLLSNDITHLLLDSDDSTILWISTKGGGLSKLDTKTMRFRHFCTRNGFPDDVVYSLLFDDAGLLWMSTNNGIVRLNPKTEKFRQYTVQDGLATNEFNQRAVAKKPDGTFVFGGVKGLESFHPADFSDNPVVPRVCITGLDINNQAITFGDSTGILDQTIEFTKQLTLPFTQNSITLHFVALEFTIPAKNKFQYYLKGAESPWSHTSVENQASYLNLSPGQYTFLVKACNSDGVWNEMPVELNITILPPWYRSNIAYVIYLLLLFALGYGTLRFILHRQRLQDRLLMEHREAERLKDLDAFKSRVFTNITHEFRTPLTVIQGMAQELEKYESGKPAGAVKKSANIIHRNGAELLRMINQLLDLAKLEANSMILKPEPTDLVAFVKYLAASFHSLALSKGIQLEIESGENEIPTSLDKDHVQTILANLLSNAIKFTPKGGQIHLSIIRSNNWQIEADNHVNQILLPKDMHSNDWAIIHVRDSGIGIPEDQLLHVFDQFYQVDNPESRRGMGSGIGLALVKELLSLMGGGLTVKSDIGKGTEFTVALPIQPADKIIHSQDSNAQEIAPELLKSENEVQNGSDNKLPNILVIEDNADVLDYLSICLEDKYSVQKATDGQAGIDASLKSIPDIIISDVMMPHKDGYEVVKTLKNDERSSHIPIILLTAKADLDSRIQGLKRGADAYLSKPFDKEELLTYIDNLLKQRQQLHARYASGALAKVETTGIMDQDLHLEDSFIQKVRGILEENMENENFDVSGLCNAVHMSRAQLHRKLTALTGKSATQYIRTMRLHKARQLLLSSDKTVSEVAFEVGFRHLQHFSSSFAAEFGQSPSSFRK